jgi:hypothetical protein
VKDRLPQPPALENRMFAVGRPYNPDRRYWGPVDAWEFNWRAGSFELRGFIANPHPLEIRAVREGPVAVALWTEADLIYLVWQFGQIHTETSYSIHLIAEQHPEEAGTPDPGDWKNKHALIPTHLVDRETGILLAMRLFTLSAEVTQALCEAIRAQAAMPFCGAEQWERKCREVERRFTTTQELVDAAQWRCRGGE